MRDNAVTFNIDPERVAIWGDSSGGHTVVSVALHMPELIKVVVDWYGPMELASMNSVRSIQDHMVADSPEGYLIGRKNVLEHPDLAAQASPVTHLTADRPTPPILIMHGGKAMLVPFNQSVRLYEALRRLGREVVFYKLEGAGHGYHGFLSDEAFNVTLDFIGKLI